MSEEKSQSPQTSDTEMPSWPQETGEGGRVGPARNGMAIAALSLGVISIIAILLLKSLPIAVLTAVCAIVFGILGLRQVKRGLADRKGFALSGLILGIVGVLLSVVLLVLSYRVYNDCKHKIGHSPSQKELTQCVNDKKK